jgi:ribosomal protein S18 acetylase RimI-like enzyme
VCAYDADSLIGFVNVAWDGDDHAFILDTAVLHRYERQGVGTRLVALATEHARAVGCHGCMSTSTRRGCAVCTSMPAGSAPPSPA